MDFLWHLLFTVSSYLPMILAYNLIFGKGKILHFGPTALTLFTSYAIYLTRMAAGNYLAALLVGLAAAFLLSAFFAWLSFRLEPDGLGIMSIAVHLTLLAVVLNWTSLTRGALGIPRIPQMPLLTSVPRFAIAMTAVAVVWIIFMAWLDRSAYGRKLAALAEHEWYARSLGVHREWIHFLAFLIGGLAAVSTQAFFPQYIRLLHPNDYLFPALIFYVMCVVAGKPGSVWGVTLATALLVLLKEGLRFVPFPASLLGPLRLMLFGAILFGVVWWRRDTLFPKQRTV